MCIVHAHQCCGKRLAWGSRQDVATIVSRQAEGSGTVLTHTFSAFAASDPFVTDAASVAFLSSSASSWGHNGQATNTTMCCAPNLQVSSWFFNHSEGMGSRESVRLPNRLQHCEHRTHAYAAEGAQTQPPKSHYTAPSHAHHHTCMYMRRHEQWVVRQATLQSSCVRTGCVAYQNPYHGAPKYLLYMAPSSAAHTPWAGQKICSSSAR